MVAPTAPGVQDCLRRIRRLGSRSWRPVCLFVVRLVRAITCALMDLPMRRIPNDEEFRCGLLTCEFRGWVERFGDEILIRNSQTGREKYGNQFRTTQAGRAVLDRIQAISKVALIVAIISLLSSIAA